MDQPIWQCSIWSQFKGLMLVATVFKNRKFQKWPNVPFLCAFFSLKDTQTNQIYLSNLNISFVIAIAWQGRKWRKILIQSVSESWVCHFAVDAEMVSKNQFYHMERDWFGAKNWPLVAEFLNVATFIEEKLSKKGFGNFSIFSKSLGEKTWNQNSGASFGMTLLFCFQNFVLWSTLKKKFRHRKFKVK